MKITFKTGSGTVPSTLSPSAQKAIKAAQNIKDGEVLDIHGLSELSRVPFQTLANMSRFLTDHKCVIGAKGWYGNLKTIAELRKQYAK